MDMNQYLEIFIEESKEHLQNMDQSILQLEQNPEDNAMLNEIFRAAHTLKGMSATMGFNKMATLTHDMENVLHALRNNEIKVTTKLIDLLFKCLDALENYVNNIANSSDEGSNEYKEIIAALDSALKNKLDDFNGEDAAKDAAQTATTDENPSLAAKKVSAIDVNQYDQNVINKAKSSGMNVFQISVNLNKGCVLKSARAFIIFQTLEKYSEIIKSIPKVEDIEDEKFDLEFTVVVISKENKELFLNELNSISEIDSIEIVPLDAKPIEDTEDIKVEQIKVNTASKEEIHNEDEKDKSEAKPSAALKSKTGKTVRVDIDRLDVLMNLVSELIIIKTRLEGIDAGAESSQTYNEAVEYMERITTSLHDAVMKVRMVPVETVFNRFPRMVRDISRDIGKEIVLNMSGEETELDRTVIDEIGDPLIHLLRNSIDHGIESSVDKRVANGKPEAGHIYLRAFQDGNNVVIEVEDDGQGIDIDKVKKKAIERGMVNQDIANSLTQKDIVDFLFKPSFSTADKITDLSGRGVGLDVVKTKIEALGGNVEVETESGKGSKFIIRLPLTLAIIQALLVYIGDEKYAIPLNSIQSIENISADEIKFVQKQEVILLRNTIIPIIRLDKVLEINKSGEDKKQLTAVIVKKGDKLSGFLVDSLIGQQEIVIKSLGKLLAGIKFMAGATILGDGNVALIIDVNSLV